MIQGDSRKGKEEGKDQGMAGMGPVCAGVGARALRRRALPVMLSIAKGRKSRHACIFLPVCVGTCQEYAALHSSLTPAYEKAVNIALLLVSCRWAAWAWVCLAMA